MNTINLPQGNILGAGLVLILLREIVVNVTSNRVCSLVRRYLEIPNICSQMAKVGLPDI